VLKARLEKQKSLQDAGVTDQNVLYYMTSTIIYKIVFGKREYSTRKIEGAIACGARFCTTKRFPDEKVPLPGNAGHGNA
jgi:hypothetical protein